MGFFCIFVDHFTIKRIFLLCFHAEMGLLAIYGVLCYDNCKIIAPGGTRRAGASGFARTAASGREIRSPPYFFILWRLPT
jgi:hypothetical protein